MKLSVERLVPDREAAHATEYANTPSYARRWSGICSGASAMIRRLGFALLLLAGCADTPAPPPVVGSVPPPPPSRFDGTYRGMATRSFGTANDCGRPSGQLYMILAQGRATGSLPASGEARGVVGNDGSLTLRATLDATQRAAGRISDSFEFTARFQTRSCAWDIRLNRES